MVEPPYCAVACRTVDDLELFVENAKTQLAGAFHWEMWLARALWDVYGCLTAFTTVGMDGELGDMTFIVNDKRELKKRGLRMFELTDLIVNDIEESALPLDVLYGGM